MVETCHEFGVEPIVTLMHFTVPRWFERDGFWRAPDAADLFARYTELAPYDTEVIEVCLALMGNAAHPAKPLLKGRLAAARR